MISRLDLKAALRGLYGLTEAFTVFRYLDRIAYRHFIQVKNIIFVQNANRQMRRSAYNRSIQSETQTMDRL